MERPSSAPGGPSPLPAMERSASPLPGRQPGLALSRDLWERMDEAGSTSRGKLADMPGFAVVGGSAGWAQQTQLPAGGLLASFNAGVARSGWLWKRFGHGHRTQWRRVWVR